MLSRRFSAREKVLLVILSLLIIAIGYYLFAWQPTSAQIQAAGERRVAAEDELLVEQVRYTSLEQMRSELAALEEKETSAAVIPPYDNAKQVMQLLNGVLEASDRYNISFENVTFEGNLALRSLSMQYSCRSYEHAKSIVRALYGGPYRCKIGAMTFTAGAQAGTNIVDMNASSVDVRMGITFMEYIAAEETTAEEMAE